MVRHGAITDFRQAEEYLDRLVMFGIKLGLEQVEELSEALGVSPDCSRFIHVAGSNGKGSTAAMLSAVLQSAGFKVGFFSSPHLVSVRERFRVNDRGISREDFIRWVARLRPIAERMRAAGRCPTYFEFVTVLAAGYFAEQQVDFVLWETGLGGRLDATNFVRPYCSVITGIALEHQQYLGETLAEIAGEKAGIIKPGRPVFSAALPREAMAVIEEKAAAEQAPLRVVDGFYDCCEVKFSFEPCFTQQFTIKDVRLSLPLAGAVQRENAKLVFMVTEHLAAEFGFDLRRALAGLSATLWPGRLQFLSPQSIIDGAHNPDGVDKLVAALRELMPGKRFVVIFAAFADKEVPLALERLTAIAEEFIFVPLRGPEWRQSYTPEELKTIFETISDLPARTAASVEQAIRLSDAGARLFTGSLFLVGEVLAAIFSPEEIINGRTVRLPSDLLTGNTASGKIA